MNLNVYRRLDHHTGEPLVGPPGSWQLPTVQAMFGDNPKWRGRITRVVNLCCGFGFGKTTIAVDAAQILLDMAPEMPVLFLEPNVRGIKRNFLPAWKAAVPPELYEQHKGDQEILWHNGSVLYYDHRNVGANQEDAVDRLAKGPNLAAVLDDETAVGFNPQMVINLHARIRHPAAPLWLYGTFSTPKVGRYGDLITGELFKSADIQSPFITIHGKTSDNPLIPPEKVEQWRSMMSRAQASRDLDGELVALEDNLWYMVHLDKSWPHGNVDDYHPRFNSNEPYWILADIGSATGAYAIVQRTESGALGRRLFSGPRWVIVAELCPQSDASVRRALEIIKSKLGPRCAGFSSGGDIDTRAAGDGKTPAYFVSKVFGDIPIFPCREDDYNKHVQHDLLRFLFEASDDVRRLTIARDLVEGKSTAVFDPDSKRGVVEMIKQDVQPPEEERRAGEYLPKGPKIRVSHMRDALLMGASMVMRPPNWGRD